MGRTTEKSEFDSRPGEEIFLIYRATMTLLMISQPLVHGVELLPWGRAAGARS